MIGSLTLTLPLPPNLANRASGCSHWRVVYKEKVAYWRELDTSQLLGNIPKPPRKPFEKARIKSVMRLGAAMDDGNAMNRHKWIEDWLTTRGYIVDDRKKNLEWEGLPEQIIKRDGNYSITITLTQTEK